jgi:cytochrome c556
MERFMLRTTIALGVVVALTACATGAAKMSSAEAIAARQQLMKEQGAAFQSIQAKAKAGQIQAIAPDAAKLVETAKRIPALFPEGSLDPNTSRAKPEIWQKWSEFEGNAKRLASQATNLGATASTGNAQSTSAAVTTMFRESCDTCHKAFRGPEIKK